MRTTVTRTAVAGCVLSLVAAATSVVGLTMSSASAQTEPPDDPLAAAVATAERLVQGRAAELLAGEHDRFIRRQTISTPRGLQYVAYERTYRGLPVIGGDFVVTTDADGNTLSLAVAQRRVLELPIQPALAKTRAAELARKAVTAAEPVKGDPALVVYAGGRQPALAWEAVVQGRDDGEPSRKKVYVDARNGKILHSVEQTASGTGTGIWSGSGLTIGTTQSGGTYTMADPDRPNLRCADYSTGKVFSGSDDTWGSTTKTDKEAGWTDEEQGVNGSEFYVGQLSSADRAKIKAYLNFDMVGSVNAGYFVNDITSDAGKALKAFYDGQNLQPEENTEGAGRSDDASFKNVGIPTSGVAAGAGAKKTSAQAQKWGGTAGSAYDPCYHQVCDKYPANVSATVLDRSADAAAYGLWKLAAGDNPPPADDFSVAVNPASGSVQAGGAVRTTVSTTTTAGEAQTVRLSASGLPSGATASFDPSSVTSRGSSDLTVSTSASTPAGTYSVTVTGAGAATRTATYSLTVTGTSSGTVTVQNPGDQSGFVGFQSFPLQIRGTSSTGRPITYKATGLPPGLSITSAGVISGTPTTRGTYSVQVTGTDSGGASGSTTFRYVINGF